MLKKCQIIIRRWSHGIKNHCVNYRCNVSNALRASRVAGLGGHQEPEGASRPLLKQNLQGYLGGSPLCRTQPCRWQGDFYLCTTSCSLHLGGQGQRPGMYLISRRNRLFSVPAFQEEPRRVCQNKNPTWHPPCHFFYGDSQGRGRYPRILGILADENVQLSMAGDGA
jgi:hypothetical protein